MTKLHNPAKHLRLAPCNAAKHHSKIHLKANDRHLSRRLLAGARSTLIATKQSDNAGTEKANKTTRSRTSGPRNRLASALALTMGVFANASQSAELSCGDRAADATRIVVAGGALAEIAHQLGATPLPSATQQVDGSQQLSGSQQIVAVDDTANYPAAIAALPRVGYVRALSTEGLLSTQPSLLLAKEDAGPPAVIDQLINLGVDVLRVPEDYSIDGIIKKVMCIGAALGNTEAANNLAANLQQTHTDLRANVKATNGINRGVVILGLRNGTPLAAGRNSSGEGLLALAGKHNALEFDGWKLLSEESLAAADPDFLLIAQHGVDEAGGLDAILTHPALRFTQAARTHRVVVLDGMAMLGFSPRTLDAARALQEALNGELLEAGWTGKQRASGDLTREKQGKKGL